MSLIRDILEREEGWRENPYLCSEGYPTVGYGFKLGPSGASLSNYQFTLPRPAGDAWLDELIFDLRIALHSKLSGLNEARQAVVLSMCYQMGIDGCLAFKKMWAAIDARDFDTAATEMMDSRWAKQTPARARRHRDVMSSGTTAGIY
jgi:lysozyme